MFNLSFDIKLQKYNSSNSLNENDKSQTIQDEYYFDNIVNNINYTAYKCFYIYSKDINFCSLIFNNETVKCNIEDNYYLDKIIKKYLEYNLIIYDINEYIKHKQFLISLFSYDYNSNSNNNKYNLIDNNSFNKNNLFRLIAIDCCKFISIINIISNLYSLTKKHKDYNNNNNKNSKLLSKYKPNNTTISNKATFNNANNNIENNLYTFIKEDYTDRIVFNSVNVFNSVLSKNIQSKFINNNNNNNNDNNNGDNKDNNMFICILKSFFITIENKHDLTSNNKKLIKTNLSITCFFNNLENNLLSSLLNLLFNIFNSDHCCINIQLKLYNFYIIIIPLSIKFIEEQLNQFFTINKSNNDEYKNSINNNKLDVILIKDLLITINLMTSYTINNLNIRKLVDNNNKNNSNLEKCLLYINNNFINSIIKKDFNLYSILKNDFILENIEKNIKIINYKINKYYEILNQKVNIETNNSNNNCLSNNTQELKGITHNINC